METLTRTPRTDEPDGPTPTTDRVGTDLRLGGAVLAVVIVGNLLWHASDAGILTALAR